MATSKQSQKRSNTFRKKKSSYQFRWWMAIILVLVMVVTGLVVLRFSRADTGKHYLQNDFGGHNYGPAVMKDLTGEHYFWCGVNQYIDASGKPANEEVVYYQRLDYATGTYSKQYPTLQPRIPGRSAGWENNSHMCDPTIVEGNFKFENKTYRYALYYDSDPDHSSRNTKIGVAFTNELRSDLNSPTIWKFANHPIICEYGTKRNTYGVGTTSAIVDPKDSSKVRMIFYDTSIEAPTPPNGRVPDVYSVEGYNGYDFGWGPNCQRSGSNTYVNLQQDGSSTKRGNVTATPHTPLIVNTNNVVSPGGDFAFDKANNWYYMVSGDASAARDWQKEGIPNGGINELFQLTIARIRPEALTDTSKGGWEILGNINSDTTKSYLNFNAGILRNGSGYLDGVTGMKYGVRTLQIWNSLIVPAGLANNQLLTDSDSALRTAQFNDMKIGPIDWVAGRVPIKRYVNPQTEHITTAGVKPKVNYSYDNQTYYVLPGKIGPLWKPLYSCATTGLYDYFLSTKENCDGFLRLGLLGYSYGGENAPDLSGRWKKLYRCWNTPGPNGNGENFMSVDQNCEGGGKPVDSSYGWVSLDPSNGAFKQWNLNLKSYIPITLKTKSNVSLS